MAHTISMAALKIYHDGVSIAHVHDADLFVFIDYLDRVTRAIFKDSVRLAISEMWRSCHVALNMH
jgi:hypothetical protein